MMKEISVSFTTAADGSASALASSGAVFGKLYALLYMPTSIDTGATVTVTCEGLGTKPILTKASAGTANLWFYPRDLVHAVADGAALTGSAGGDRALPIFAGVLKVVIASGGNVKTGKVIAYFEE
jgi:hypothetical protein